MRINANVGAIIRSAQRGNQDAAPFRGFLDARVDSRSKEPVTPPKESKQSQRGRECFGLVFSAPGNTYYYANGGFNSATNIIYAIKDLDAVSPAVPVFTDDALVRINKNVGGGLTKMRDAV